MQEPIDIDRALMEFERDYPMGLDPMHMMQTEEDRERFNKLWEEMREKCKDIDFKVVLPEADYNSIEKRAKDFIESSQLWDDRILGADEEYVEVCSDPDTFRAALELAHQREAEALKSENNPIVLGCGPRRVGGAIGVLAAFAQNKVSLFDFETLAVEEEKLPMFDKDYSQTKLRKGRGHNKLKKGKRK